MTAARRRTPPQPPMELYLQQAEREEKAQVDQLLAATPEGMAGVITLAEEMQQCKDEADRLTAHAKQYKDRYDQIRCELLPAAMRAQGLVQSNGKGSFTFPGGKVHLETSLKASCTVQNKPNLFKWLRRNKLDDLIKEDVSATTLASLVKERREDGLMDPPGLSIFEEVKAKITKAK